MGIFDIFRDKPEAKPRPRAEMPGEQFSGLDDPRFLEYVRGHGGREYDSAMQSLKNMAVLRCVSLICESVGMLPMSLIRNDATKVVQVGHPAHRLLKLAPNAWQTAYEFKSQMQLRVLQHGNAYARIVRSGSRPVALHPIDPDKVKVTQRPDMTMLYTVTSDSGRAVEIAQRGVLHLRDLSATGLLGMSRLNMAGDAIALAQSAAAAASRMFKTGVMASGAIEIPDELSDIAYQRMKDSMASEYSGAENIHKWMLLEGGGKANPFGTNAADAQHIENRNVQIEEVARAFGVPRPLLMMDDTSWGSGIQQLGIYFVQYGLQHWLTAWEQACARSLLTDQELDVLTFKFNERALMRGTFDEQATYLSKALGSGGTAPWMTQNEVRDLQDLPESGDEAANTLRNPMTQQEPANEPPKTT